MAQYSYFPILKTTSAELRAYAELPARVQDGILPIFELTRSRRSKNNPDGDAWKQIEEIEEYLIDRPFILDLTTEETLQNKHIESMLMTPANGYEAWVSFVQRISKRELSVIPVIHYNPEELSEVKKQIRELQKLSKILAFRVAVDDEVAPYVREIGKSHSLENLILILDAGFIEPGADNPFPAAIDALGPLELKATVCAASSFPSSVANYGDHNGNFPISEVAMTEALRSDYEIFHGDFGSIHPVRYEGRWGGWVPRIDFPEGNVFHYYRYRREEGGYTKAAQKVVADRHYRTIPDYNVWGDAEIAAAASGQPNGRSPSHWISVRANLYLVSQFLRLKKYPKMSL